MAPGNGGAAALGFSPRDARISLLADLLAKLDSADEVDILVSFIKWSGVRKLVDRFEAGGVTDAPAFPAGRCAFSRPLTRAPRRRGAVLALARLLGVTVKISYDTRRTRLHAKAWLLLRTL